MYCTLVLYRKPSGVTSVTNIWDHVEVDTFVAVSLQCYDKVPVIGKVLEKHQSGTKRKMKDFLKRTKE